MARGLIGRIDALEGAQPDETRGRIVLVFPGETRTNALAEHESRHGKHASNAPPFFVEVVPLEPVA